MSDASSFQARVAQVLAIVKAKAPHCRTWIDLHNAIYGIGAPFGQLFPTQSERVAFSKTDEHAEIQRLIAELPGPGHVTDPQTASGRILLRLPKSLHAALIAEAKAEGVSLNQLCVAKLSIQLRAEIS